MDRLPSAGAASGPEPRRIAEVLVTTGTGRRVRASGYRVTASAVLTAAHVLRGAARVEVRFDAQQAGEWSTPATRILTTAVGDVAVLTIEPRAGEEFVEPARFGRISDRAAVLECVAVGFPRFKLRREEAEGPREEAADPGAPPGRAVFSYRDRAHAGGRIPVLSNAKEGTLEIITDPPEPEPGRSPWEGMSGAAVWVGGRIVGVISKQHRSDSPARLAAARVDRWHTSLGEDERNTLCPMLGLPPYAAALPDSIPAGRAEMLATGHADQVRDLAPERLLDREAELAELVAFCAGDRAYAWWQGEPWAGKSALAAWLVLHPPAGVTVVSFFITSRWSGQADSEAFTDALVQQLAAAAGEPEPSATTPTAREQARRHLLAAATARAVESGRRLLLVVDGLDEDEGGRVGSGRRPSIASLLPIRPPDGLRVLVTSRPHPSLPADVPGDHPLRTCTPRRLTPSPHARWLSLRANEELRERRASGDPRQVDILGYVTASGGGLTQTELAQLADVPAWLLQDLFASVFGRTIRGRTARDANRVYLFAHETIRQVAEELFQDDLPRYRQRIHDWSDRYAARGWPEETPRYLLRSYGRLLATIGDAARLAALAADPARHDRMLVREHHDTAALAEIRTARQLLSDQPRPELAALGRLAIAEWRLRGRNSLVPERLPEVWVRLGQRDRGEQSARTITRPARRAEALVRIATVLVTTEPDQARRLLDEAERCVQLGGDPAEAIDAAGGAVDAGFAELYAVLGATDPDRAERIVAAIAEPYRRVEGLAALAAAAAPTDPARSRRLGGAAERVADALTDPYRRRLALRAVAAALAPSDPDGAARIAAAIAEPAVRAGALAGMAAALAATDPERAARFADEARRVADHVAPHERPLVLRTLAETLAASDPDRAVQFARAVAEPYDRASALAAVAVAHPGRARRLLDEAHRGRALPAATGPERVTPPEPGADQEFWRGIIAQRDAERAAQPLREVAVALAREDPDEAERIAAAIPDPGTRDRTLAGIVAALAEGDGEDRDRGARIARTISTPADRVRSFAALAAATATVDPDRARRLADEAERSARTITDADRRGWLLVEVAAARATSDPAGAERTARGVTDHYQRSAALTAVAAALPGTDPERARRLADEAEQTARTILEPDDRAAALTAAAGALAGVDPDAARRLAVGAVRAAALITSPFHRDGALRSAVVTALAAGDPDRAERVTETITAPGARTEAWTAIAAAVVTTDADRARRLARRAELTARAIASPYDRATALAEAAAVLAAAGSGRAARRLARHAARSARAGSVGLHGDGARAEVVAALATVDPDRAERLAGTVSDPYHRSSGLLGVAAAVVATDPARAGRLIEEAERAATVSLPMTTADLFVTDRHGAVLADVVAALATIDPGRAERLARTVSEPYHQAQACLAVAATIGSADPGHARELIDGAERAARDLPDSYRRSALLMSVAGVLTRLDTGYARRLAAELISEYPFEALRLVGRLDPEAVREISEHLVACLPQEPGSG